MIAGRRAQHRQDVQARLIQAALELFGERSFDEVTIDAITARAGVSRRTFFRYFPTKEDVVLARRRSQLATFVSRLAEPPGAPPFDRVRGAFAGLAEEYRLLRARILAEHALFASAPTLLSRDLEIDRAFEAAIADALADRATDEGTVRRARQCAGAIMGALRVVVEEWARGEGRGDLAAWGAEALSGLASLAEAVAAPGAAPREAGPSLAELAQAPGRSTTTE